MNALPRPQSDIPDLSVRYQASDDPRQLLGSNTLAVIGFGPASPELVDDPRYLHVPLQPIQSPAPYEVWSVDAPVEIWSEGSFGGARSGCWSFGHGHQAETEGDIAAAAEAIYRGIFALLHASEHPHLLRMWNYFSDITQGEGDLERYRLFCSGRAAGLELNEEQLPAATAIGTRNSGAGLLVYWLSARTAGVALENPRQVPAYRYPRDYGPRSPSFARAMLAVDSTSAPLMLSGTAAIVGHGSQHAGDLPLQLEETLCNLESLLRVAGQRQPRLNSRFDSDSLLKIYLRHESDADAVDAILRRRLPAGVPTLMLQGDVCRRELLVEIDGFHGLPSSSSRFD